MKKFRCAVNRRLLQRFDQPLRKPWCEEFALRFPIARRAKAPNDKLSGGCLSATALPRLSTLFPCRYCIQLWLIITVFYRGRRRFLVQAKCLLHQVRREVCGRKQTRVGIDQSPLYRMLLRLGIAPVGVDCYSTTVDVMAVGYTVQNRGLAGRSLFSQQTNSVPTADFCGAAPFDTVMRRSHLLKGIHLKAQPRNDTLQ